MAELQNANLNTANSFKGLECYKFVIIIIISIFALAMATFSIMASMNTEDKLRREFEVKLESRLQEIKTEFQNSPFPRVFREFLIGK